jgi:dynein heavy chain
MAELMGKVQPEDRTPYVVVAFQECERMNMLTSEIRRSLKELNLGLKVHQNCYKLSLVFRL